MPKIAAVLLSLLWMVAPTYAQAQALPLARVKTLLSDAGYKKARISDGAVLVDGFGEAGHTFAFTVADQGAALTIGAYWRIPSDKQGSVPTLGMLRANSSSDFMFGLNGEDGALGLQIESTYAAALVSKAMLKRSVEQLLETIEGNEELRNTDNWPAKPVGADPQATAPPPSDAAPTPPDPLGAAAVMLGGTNAPAPQPLLLQRVLFVGREAKAFGDVAARGTNAFPQGEPLLVYLQPVGLTAAGSDGKGRVGLGLDYAVRTRDGTPMAPRKPLLDQEVPFTGPTPPQLFVTSTVEVAGFAPGDYTITFTLRDTLGHRTTATDLPFSVTPNAAKAPPAPVAVAAPITSPVPAAAPTAPTIARLGSDGLVAQGVRIRSARRTLSAGRIELRGTPLTEAELAHLLDPASPTSLGERLGAVTAKEIIVPEIKGEPGAEETDPQITTLRDLRFADVARGRIGSLAIGGGMLKSAAPDGPPLIAFARLDAADLDLALLLSLAAPAAGPGDLRTAYRSFAVEGIEIRGAGPGDVSRIARIAGRDLRVRPTSEGWAATFQRTQGLFAGEAPEGQAPTGDRVRALAPLAELLDAIDPGSLDVTGLEVAIPDERTNTVRAARLGFGPDRDGFGEVRLDGFGFHGPEGSMRLASFAIEGIGLRGSIAGLRAVAASDAREIGATEARRLAPRIRATRFGGLDVNLTKPGAEPVRLAIDAVELATANPVDGVPTSLRLALNNIVVPIASATGMDPTGQLGQLGYSTLAVSTRADLAWNETDRQFTLSDLSVEGADMGRVALRGVVGNVSKDVFSPDMTLAAVAAQGAAIRSLDLEVEDGGLVQRLLAAQSKATGESVEAVRAEAGAYATLGLPGMLGDNPATKALGRAVAQFIARPGRLYVGLKAKSAAGVAAADLAGASNPAAFFDKVDLTAEAR